MFFSASVSSNESAKSIQTDAYRKRRKGNLRDIPIPAKV